MVGRGDALRINKAIKVLNYIEPQFLTEEENRIKREAVAKLEELLMT